MRRHTLLLPTTTLVFVLLLTLFSSACQSDNKTGVEPPAETTKGENEELENNPGQPELEEPDSDTPLTEAEIKEHLPNELGEVMVLMYHNIGEKEAEWTRTPDNLRQDLEVLYEKGYRSVNLLDYVRGKIDLPLGTTPVVLTFDDSSLGQFNYLEGDEGPLLDPDSAIGILEDFYQEHPDFGRAATFYIFYPTPFRQSAYIQEKLTFLQENGYEIGNHSYTHANLARINQDEVVKELALHAGKTAEILPGYDVRSLALPYGTSPENAALLQSGSYNGYTYENEAVLLVGYRPAPSPFANNFNPMRLARIRGSEMKVDGVGLYDWLDYFEKHPDRRYISDGNPSTLTAPERLRDKLNIGAAGDLEIRFYNVD